MFETSVVREQAQGAEKRFGLLSASVAVHSIVILAAIILSIAAISFPKNAPNQMTPFVQTLPITIPPPLGTPHAQPSQPAARPATPHQPAAPASITTPTVVPDAIPTVSSSGPVAAGSVDANGTGNGPIGDEHGVPGGVGEVAGPPGVTEGPAAPMRAVGDVRAAVVLHRVEPLYPRAAQVMHLSGWVILECVIGRDGRIHDAHVLKSSHSVFEQSALDAVQQWTFAPGSYQGRTVDTYFDLTVTFTLK